MLVAVSALSGLGLPLPGAGRVAAVALLAAAGLAWWERRAAAPLVDLRMLAAAGIAPALAGALCAYLVLFGPLVLFPQVLTARGGSALRAGLLLTALPAGFGLAAVAAERLLPARWPDRRRCAAGGLLAAVLRCRAGGPRPGRLSPRVLALLGVGLGTYIPANNAAIMAAIPAGTRPPPAGW